MSLDAIKELLLKKIGLDTETIGSSSLQHALDTRLAVVQRDNLADYFRLLSTQRRELDALIEEIVVPETWFFRNSAPFSACVEQVKQIQRQSLGRTEPVRILSVPCSTGEEPYSIAIALAQASVNMAKVEISALDISRTALNTAQVASYHRNAFREMPEGLREKYFRQQQDRYVLDPEIRQFVHFESANVVYSALSPRPEYFDIIFCRNLLIYFKEQTRAQIYEKIHRALVRDGCLFVGHAESAQVDKKRFKPLPDHASYGFIKRPLVTKVTGPVKKSLALEPQRLSQTSLSMATGQSVISLNFVDQLIEKGDDARAAHLLQQYLNMQPESVEAKFLEGKRLFRSDQFKQADFWLKKLLFLHPTHQPSLQLLLQMAEKRFDLDAVRKYRDKLKRIGRN